MNNTKKFTNTYNTTEWEIETPSGWQDFDAIAQTIPFRVWVVKTATRELRCADDHILHRLLSPTEAEEVYTKDINPGDYLLTNTGPEEVVSITETDAEEPMYDLANVADGNIYYTSGFLSHNTTTVTSYLLHYALFTPNIKIAILANKGDIAKKILADLQKSYENIPMWMQQGIISWNKWSLELENGSKIVCSTTSGSGLRGNSFNCLAPESVVTVRRDGKIMTLTLRELEDLLNKDMQTHPTKLTHNESEWDLIDNKYKKLYFRIIERAKTRVLPPEEYSESHHIQPKCLGGSDHKFNLVDLTAKEHFIVHLLLTKFTKGKSRSKMVYTAHMMANFQKRGQKITSAIYARLRKDFKDEVSKTQTGRKISEETKEKLSKAMMGKYKGVPKSEGFAEKISKALKGRKNPWNQKTNKDPDKIRKMAEKHRGMKRSEASRKRMSDAAKGRVPANKGIKNPNYNLKWYHDPVEKIEVRRPEGQQPDGYVRGKLKKSNPLHEG